MENLRAEHAERNRLDVFEALQPHLTGEPAPVITKRLRRAAPGEICRIIREEEPSLPSARLTTITKAEQTETAQHRWLQAQRLLSELRSDLDWLVMKALDRPIVP